jgi:UDP-N-acetylglucosamine transferase subunit ALG13
LSKLFDKSFDTKIKQKIFFLMILVLLGTFPLNFDRPLVALEKLLNEGVISDEVIVQNGYTSFESSHMNLLPFLPLEELLDLYKKADLIITQAGTGSIIKGLKLNKKVIAIARLAKYGECVDDHQLELVHEFAAAQYLLPWYEGDNLEEILLKANHFDFQPYKSNNKEIINYLINYIDNI